MNNTTRMGYRQLVRENSDFRWLWGGQIVSLLGDWFNTIASVALVTSLTDSGLAIGGLFGLRMLAPFCTSPVAGVVADRYSRRSILITADLARGVIVLGMLAVRSAEMVWLLYVLTALQLGTSSFFFTARNAILPDVVDSRALGAANAITSATWSVMLTIGAALGGFVAGWLGVYTAFAIDAVTFFISAALVARVRRSPHALENRKLSLIDAIGQYVAGLRYLAAHPDTMAIALHKSALTILFGTTFRVVQVGIAERIFPIGEQAGIAMGMMFAASGVGTAVGPLTARLFTRDEEWRLRWAIAAGYLLGAGGLLLTAQLSSFRIVLFGSFVSGIGNGLLWVFSSQLLLQRLHTTIRGRVFGSEFAMFTLASAIGSTTVGSAIDTRLGIDGVLVVAATLAMVPLTAWSLWTLSQAMSTSGDPSEEGSSDA